MKKHIHYTDEPVGKLKIVRDSLPPPEKLVFKRKSVKVTMALDVESVLFFKKIAKQNNLPYQTMISGGCQSPTVQYTTFDQILCHLRSPRHSANASWQSVTGYLFRVAHLKCE